MNIACPKCNVESVREGKSYNCPQCGDLLAITTAPELMDELDKREKWLDRANREINRLKASIESNNELASSSSQQVIDDLKSYNIELENENNRLRAGHERLNDENVKFREIVERYMRIEQDLIEDCVRLEAKLRAKSPEEYDGIYRQLRAEQSNDYIDTEGMPVSFPRSYEELLGCYHALRSLHYAFEQDNEHFMAAFIEAIQHGDAISAGRIHELHVSFLNDDCPNREELIDERESERKRWHR